MDQSNSYEMNQNTAEAVSEALYAKLDSGEYSDLLAVATNEMATREHLLEAAALCTHIVIYKSSQKEELTKAILDHQQADDTVASLLCNNAYSVVWKMVARSACVGKRTLSKLVIKCRFLDSKDCQEGLAEAILDNPKVTPDIVTAMAGYEEAPYAQKVAQARLNSTPPQSRRRVSNQNRARRALFLISCLLLR